MVAAEAVGRKLVGAGQQVSSGSLPITGERTMEGRGTPPKAPIRFWSIVLCAVTLVLACPAALRAQTFQTIAPLAFTKVYAGADPLPQVITVASTDPTSTINFTATAVNSAGNDWLSVSGGGTFNAGTTPQAITVAVKPGATMGSGTYTAQINVKSTDGKKSLVVPVSLIVSPASSASFAESGGALTFSMAKSGNAPPEQTVDIANEGSGTLNWTASGTTADGGNWLTLSPTSGTAPSALSIGVVPSNLPFGGLVSGSFVGQVTLNTAGDSVTIPVTVTVGTSVFEQVNALSFTMTYGGGAPLPQVFTVASTDLPIDFTARAANPGGSSLVSVSGGGTFNDGTTPQAITVSISPAMNQPVGTYTSEVIVKSTDGTESMVVPVTLTVEPSTATYFDQLPGELSFSLATKGSAPPTQPIAVRNGGSGTLNWAASTITSDGGNWLTLSATNGTAPSMLSVGIDPSSLPGRNIQPGTFTGQVLLQIGEERATIPVTVTVGTSVFEQVNALSFTMTYGGGAPLPQVFTVASTDLPIDFTARAANPGGSSLVSVSGGGTFNDGTTPQAITVSISPAMNQPVGTYTSEVIVKSTDGTESMVVPVTLTVEPSTATYFDQLPGELSFSLATKGSAPPTQPIAVRNGGSGTLNWAASTITSDGGNWLTLSPTSGTAPSALSIGVVPSNLPFGGLVSGSFVGQVTLNTAGDSVTIPVTVTVGTSVFEQVNALSFTMTYGGGAPLPQVFTVASTDLPIDFTARAANPGGSSLVSVSGGGTFNDGTTPQAITVSISPAMNQPVGTYTSEVIVKSTDGTESMVVPVTLTVEPSTATYFDITQGALTFSMTPSGMAPQAQTLPVRNGGISTFTWSGIATTADGGDWLSLSPGQGTAPSAALVSVNPANLPHNGLLPGAFTGLVTLQAASGNVSVPVTYTVGSSVFQQVPALSFGKAYGGANPGSQVFTVASMGANLTFTAAAVNSTGGWLKVAGGGTFNPATTPQTITVTAQPDTALPIGVYTAEIIVKTTDGTEPMLIPVTLTIGSSTQAAATPTFSPAGGTYASAQTVTISDATTGSAIYYTTDGSQPTVKSALYSGPVQVTASGTLNAIAIASGYTQSATASATYTITGGQCVVIDNSGGFTATGLTLNGGATVTGNLLQLTDGGFDEARSAFSSERVPIDSFVTDFTFQLLDAYAEGFTFTVQGDGPQAVGASGGGLGYQGIPNSAALKIDLFDTAGEGYDSTGFYINGAAPTVPSIDLGQAGIDIHNGHPFAVHVANVNGVYAGSITDTVTGVSASTYLQGYSVPAGSMAFVGFTAGTSSEGSATQNILTWKYQGGTACGH